MQSYLPFITVCLLLSLGLLACKQTRQVDQANQAKQTNTTSTQVSEMDTPIKKTDAEWKSELTAEEYRVLRKKGTERSFTGEYWDHKGQGIYVCAGCQTPLFDSETKYKSGTGWPSFYDMVDNNVTEEVDRTLGMERREVLCANCGGHLGHVFADGPRPTGQRYCINSVSLDFVEKKKD